MYTYFAQYSNDAYGTSIYGDETQTTTTPPPQTGSPHPGGQLADTGQAVYLVLACSLLLIGISVAGLIKLRRKKVQPTQPE